MMINKMCILSLLLAAVIIAPGLSYAADGRDAAQVQLTVLKKAADNGSTFSSISDAVEAASDADDKKQYKIIVNPGVYEEQVNLPPHVSLEGVGQGAVTIKAVTSGGCSSKSAPTLTVSDDSSIKNLSVENINLDGCSTAILVNGGTEIENVVLSAAGKEGHGIQISAGTKDIVSIKQAQINVESTFSDAWGILVFPNELEAITIDNVTSACSKSSGNNCGGIAVWKTVKNLVINNSTFISKGGRNAIAMDLYAADSQIKIHYVKASAEGGKTGTFGARVGDNAYVFFNDSEIKASGPNSIGILMQSTGKLTVSKSTVSGAAMGLKQMTDKGLFEVRDCTLVGGHNGFKGVDTIYNCRDGKGKLLDDF